MKNDKLIKWCVDRIKNNQNNLIFCSGGTGSGKSYSALKLAQIFSKHFKKRFPIENCTFTMKEFMGRVNSKDLQTGSVLIFDEFGVGMNSRASLTLANRIFGFLLQTFRHKNFICIFTSPHFGYVDLSARRLFHLWLETQSIDRKKKLCWVRPHFGNTDQKTGELKWTLPKLGLNKVMGRYPIGMPSPNLIKEYEKKKEEYTAELNQNIMESLENVDAWGREIKEDKKTPDPAYQKKIMDLARKVEYG